MNLMWLGEENWFPLVIIKHPQMGHLCGYVGVPAEHPWYKMKYNQCLEGCEGEPNSLDPTITTWHCSHDTPECLIDVHGGLTYSGMGDDEYLPAGYWWFGFDCAHAWDLIPGLPNLSGGSYKDKDYVERECRSLAQQLAKVVKIIPIPEAFLSAFPPDSV